jgi:hypothetical protein
MENDNMKALYSALSKAQGDMGSAKKDRTNPHLKYAYATLASIIDAVREPFSKNGLSHMSFVSSHPVEGSTWDISVTLRIAHVDGGVLESTLTAPMPDSKGLSHVQTAGLVITYLRRYLMMAMCGVAPDDDDDGASAPPVQKAPVAQPRASNPEFLARALSVIAAATTSSELDAAALSLSKEVVATFPDPSHPSRLEIKAAVGAKKKSFEPPVDAAAADDIPVMGSGVKPSDAT